jgi:hypothetical protein
VDPQQGTSRKRNDEAIKKSFESNCYETVSLMFVKKNTHSDETRVIHPVKQTIVETSEDPFPESMKIEHPDEIENPDAMEIDPNSSSIRVHSRER